MARDTSLTYSLYGKDVTASKAMKNVGHEVKKVGLAFAAAGALAAKFAIDSVKAAAEDEASQKQLAVALKNTTGATKAQVASTEKLISKLQLTYGVADDKLRPAFATLTRSTKSVSESSKLMNTALDISAATGKDLGTVSLALAKAHNGQVGALKRLGIPLSDAIIKNKDFNGAMKVVNATMTGSAKAATQTMAGKYAVLQQNINETKESIGYALLPTVKKLSEYVLNTVVPNVQSFIGVFTGDKGINSAMHDGTLKAHEYGLKVKEVIQWIIDHKDGLIKTGKAIASVFVGIKIGGIVGMLTKLAAAFIPVTAAAATAAGAEAAATGGASLATALPAIAAIATTFGVAALTGLIGYDQPKDLLPSNMSPEEVKADRAKQLRIKQQAARRTAAAKTTYIHLGTTYHWDANKKQWWTLAAGENGSYRDYSTPHPPGAPRAVGGSVIRGLSYMVGERGPETFTPTTTGRITPNGVGGGSGVNVTVQVHGSVIRERDLAISVRDQIAQLMRRRGIDPAILGV